MNLEVDGSRVVNELHTLAQFSATPSPAITRIVFTPSDMEARSWLKRLIGECGLVFREDAVGNLFARWEGSDSQLSPIATGSHIDAIPNSGQYDGTVGVLGALEAIRSLQRARFVPRRSIELIVFTSEEPTRFGIGCLGSRLLSGTLSANAAMQLRDAEGATLDQVRNDAGFSGGLNELALPLGHYHAFVELHIEQGPILEREGLSIGIVTDIAAPGSLRIAVQGEGGHAGAVLMAQRHDALLGAAEIALAVEVAAKSTGASDSVATTGVCEVYPGAVNSIPSEVKLSVDVRDTDLKRRDGMVSAIQQSCVDIARRRELTISTEIVNADSPAHCDPTIVDAIGHACSRAGYSSKRMVSRAYHDSLFLSRIAPTGMIFIPCRDGVSHRPDEYAAPEHISQGITVLAEALAELASQ